MKKSALLKMTSQEFKPHLLRAFELYKGKQMTLEQMKRIGRIYSHLYKKESTAYTARYNFNSSAAVGF